MDSVGPGARVVTEVLRTGSGADLHIEEHYTDTNGFTDHVFALMYLLGYRFAPRIRDLDETWIYTP